MVAKLSQPEPGSSPLAFDTEYAQPLWRQFVIILAKNLVSYWRRVSALQIQAAVHLTRSRPPVAGRECLIHHLASKPVLVSCANNLENMAM
jgi:hypothetical protein